MLKLKSKLLTKRKTVIVVIGVALALLIMLKSKELLAVNNAPSSQVEFKTEKALIPETLKAFQSTGKAIKQVYTKIQGLQN